MITKGCIGPFNGVATTPNGDGTLQYSNIIADQGLFNWKIAQNYDAGQATAYSDSQNAFITFDNPASVANKAKFANDSGLHGLMLWDISGDVKVDDLNYSTLSLAHAAKSA